MKLNDEDKYAIGEIFCDTGSTAKELAELLKITENDVWISVRYYRETKDKNEEGK
jgi:hypothetical protein